MQIDEVVIFNLILQIDDVRHGNIRRQETNTYCCCCLVLTTTLRCVDFIKLKNVSCDDS